MTDNFAALFEKSLKDSGLRAGDLVKGTVIKIDNKFILIDVGLKSEGVVAIDEFKNMQGELEVKAGDEVEVVIDMLADDYGETRLSRLKAKRAESWARLVHASETAETVLGVITGRVKGGFTVEIDGVRAFLPGSLLDVRPIQDTASFEGQAIEFKIIKIDEKRSNIVVSRRAVIEAENSVERSKLLEGLTEGQVISGTVKNLTDYGAFVDLGGVDGLLHITDIAWKRVKHPSELLHIGDSIDVVVLKFDREKSRVSLGLKQLHQDPWGNIKERFAVGKKLSGKVTNITDYGCFVEIADGVEGLVHMSEMDWTNKNIHPSKVVQLGDEVNVVVLELDEERRRISLGMKQCASNPWISFAEKFKKGDRLSGHIKSITDFGIFIGLEGNIDGLIHLSDISWEEPGEKAIRKYKKGDEIEAVVLAIDPERERISLGIKQLQDDAFSLYAEAHPKGSLVKGKVVAIEDKQAFIELAEEVKGRIKAAEIAAEKVDDINVYFKVGDEVEAKVISVNHKDRVIGLSIRAKMKDQDGSGRSKSSEESYDTIVGGKLGDLLKQHMSNNATEESEQGETVNDE
ncbi:MAG: 30S ribosomal protein S1 [Gammaproteobacteria bacterium GWE2_42_36]|nr:MAG: 30S ribosomal protein S1 [Gammaproteobacteria bacterium GWE2_42_36]HCU04711.1 30S ribosomal protein S1 [Coxiellaceae bacterium]